MKKLLLIFVSLLGLQSCIISNRPDAAFVNYQNEANFTKINIPMWIAKPIVKKALREDGESEELIRLTRKVSDIKVMTVSGGNKAMITDFANYLSKNNFEEWMTIKKDSEIIKIQAKQSNDEIRNFMITVASGNELIYVDVKGKFNPDDISRVASFSEKHDVKDFALK